MFVQSLFQHSRPEEPERRLCEAALAKKRARNQTHQPGTTPDLLNTVFSPNLIPKKRHDTEW